MNVIQVQPDTKHSINQTLVSIQDIDTPLKKMQEELDKRLQEFEERITKLQEEAGRVGFPDFSENLTSLEPLPYSTWLFIKRHGNNTYVNVKIGGVIDCQLGRNGSGYWDNMIATFPLPPNTSFTLSGRGYTVYRFRCH